MCIRDSNNIIHDASTDFVFSSPCTNLGWTAVTGNPMLMVGAGTESNDAPIDPRPACGSPAYSDVDSVPDAFFTDVSFKGAFGADNWLDGWSLLEYVSTPLDCGATYDPISLCGDITSDLTLYKGTMYIMSCQVFVKAGVTLAIEPGATIYSTPTGPDGKAPALVIEQGAYILAEGTEDLPITFTALNPEEVSTETAQTDTDSEGLTMLETRGKWGGLIINGKAPITGGTDTVEGLTNVPYGGTDPADDSGCLLYTSPSPRDGLLSRMPSSA